jgi:hypothetical protein
MILDQFGRELPVPQSPFSEAIDSAVRRMTLESIERTFQLLPITSPIVDERGLPIYSSGQKIGSTYAMKIPARFTTASRDH